MFKSTVSTDSWYIFIGLKICGNYFLVLFHWLKPVPSVDIGSISSLGLIRYFKIFLGHLEGYFENWEKDLKSTKIYLRITQIPRSISKIPVKFIKLVVVDAIDFLSGTIGGIGDIPNKILVTDSKVGIGNSMSSVADPNFQIESYRHRLPLVTKCPMAICTPKFSSKCLKLIYFLANHPKKC